MNLTLCFGQSNKVFYGKGNYLIISANNLDHQHFTNMDNRTCKKCGHLCHCIEADHDGCKCTGCECGQRAEDTTYENSGGIVIDDTNECESCQ